MPSWVVLQGCTVWERRLSLRMLGAAGRRRAVRFCDVIRAGAERRLEQAVWRRRESVRRRTELSMEGCGRDI